MGLGSLNPVRAVKKAVKSVSNVVKKVTGRDNDDAKKQEEEYQAALKKQQEQTDQQHNKAYGNDADSSELAGLGEYGADSGASSGLTGLGGVDTNDLKLQKKKLLGA